MPKNKGIREVELHKDAKALLKRHIDYAIKNGLGTEESVTEMFYGIWEAGDKLAEKLHGRGVEDRYAQIAAVDTVKATLGRSVVKPKYGVIINPIHVRQGEFDDDKIKGKKHPMVSAFAQVQLVNLKNGNKFDERLAEVNAYRENAHKISDLEEGQIKYIEAATGYTDGLVLNLLVDDRCAESKDTNEKLSNVEDLMTHLYNITPINEVMENYSNEKVKRDYRLVEGRVNYVQSPKNKNFMTIELTDSSVLLEDLEKNKSSANLRCMVNTELATRFGKDSIVRMLGTLRYSDHEQYGKSVTMLFPVMVYPMLLIEPEVVETQAISDDSEEDASDYFAKKDEEKKAESVSDGPPEPAGNAKTEVEPADVPDELKSHPCVKDGNFGKYEEAECKTCVETEPDVAKLCMAKTKENLNAETTDN